MISRGKAPNCSGVQYDSAMNIAANFSKLSMIDRFGCDLVRTTPEASKYQKVTLSSRMNTPMLCKRLPYVDAAISSAYEAICSSAVFVSTGFGLSDDDPVEVVCDLVLLLGGCASSSWVLDPRFLLCDPRLLALPLATGALVAATAGTTTGTTAGTTAG